MGVDKFCWIVMTVFLLQKSDKNGYQPICSQINITLFCRHHSEKLSAFHASNPSAFYLFLCHIAWPFSASFLRSQSGAITSRVSPLRSSS